MGFQGERIHPLALSTNMSTVLQSLNSALHQALATDPLVILLGEDLLDPYGGAFKVTRGLSSSFPDRVLTTPISEAGMVGVATGMAMRGLKPVVEIMFGDFVTLIADQVINHTSKFSWMYNDQVKVPLVIRTPMGGRRGYGPTHSQSLEKLFLGVPGLRVLAPCSLGDPGALLLEAIQDPGPVLFIENKLLYYAKLKASAGLEDFLIDLIEEREAEPKNIPAAKSYSLMIQGAPEARLTLTAYGYMVELAIEAAYKLAFEHEIFTELIVLTQLAPSKLDPVLASARKTGRLLAVEEGNRSHGWGAEVIAQTAEALGPSLKAARRSAALDLPIPASSVLEQTVLPGVDTIIQAALDMLQDQ
jgi:acetoin:2,6-dichlorophenolindophenol oxidoreductase subunit beta